MSFPYCPRGCFLLFGSVINNSCLICIEFMLDNSKIKICLQPAAVCGVYAEIRFQLTCFNACSTAIGDGLSALQNYFEVSISRGQLAPEERFPGTFVHVRQKFKPEALTICQKWLAKQDQS